MAATNTIMQRMQTALQRMTGFNAGLPQGQGVALTGQTTMVGAIPLRGEAPTDYQRTGNTVRLRGFERHPVVMACVRAIVEIASAVPLQLYSKKTEKGADDDVREVIKVSGAKAPGQILVDAPSSFLSAQRLRSLTFVHYLIYGNAFWFLERPESKSGIIPGTPKPPISIRIVHPEDVMTVYVDERGYPLWYMWRDMLGYMHTSPSTDLMHFRDLNAKGLVFGFPRAASALNDIIGDDEASQFVRETVTNSGNPNAYALVNEETTLEEAAAAEAAFYEKMVKRGNRGRFVFMGGVKDIKAVGFNLRDLEFPDLRRVSREDICAAFGVDPRIVGISSATRDGGLSGSQYREARVRLIQQTIEPTMRGFVSELDLWLAPEFGDVYYRFDPDVLQALVEDDDATSNRVRAEVASGIRTVEEAREAIELPAEFKDGDLLMVQKVNMTPTSVATATGDMTPEEFSEANAPLLPFGAPPGAGDPNAAPPTSPSGGGETVPVPDASLRPDASKTTGSSPDKQAETKAKNSERSEAIVEPAAPVAPAAPPSIVRRRGSTISPDERVRVWRDFDTRATSEESKYRRAAMLQFADEQRTVTAIMGRETEVSIASRKIARLYQPKGTVERQWVARMQPIIASTFIKGAQTVLHGIAGHRMERESGTLTRDETTEKPTFNIAFNVHDPNVQQAIIARSARLAELVGTSTGQSISDAISIGIKDGMSMNEMADLVNQMAFGGEASQRAMTIARTESIGAMNQGQFAAAAQSGVIEGKEWLTQGDDRVRDSHDECEAEGIVDVEDVFSNGLMYPGDPLGAAEDIINCRCSLLLYDTLENVGQSTLRFTPFEFPYQRTMVGVAGDPSGGEYLLPLQQVGATKSFDELVALRAQLETQLVTPNDMHDLQRQLHQLDELIANHPDNPDKTRFNPNHDATGRFASDGMSSGELEAAPYDKLVELKTKIEEEWPSAQADLASLTVGFGGSLPSIDAADTKLKDMQKQWFKINDLIKAHPEHKEKDSQRFNPFHDPADGKFTTGPAGGSGGGVFGMDPSGGGMHPGPTTKEPPTNAIGGDPVPRPSSHAPYPKPTPETIARDTKRFHELKQQWAKVNNDLLDYVDTPNDPTAVSMLSELKDITKEVHALNADDYSILGVGLPGGPQDVVVVGAGPGGLAASINAASDGLETTVYDAQPVAGGQSKFSSRIENYPGFPVGVTGKQLSTNMADQAQRLGTDVQLGVRVVALTHNPETGIKTLTLSNGKTVDARTVVLAGGVEFRKLEFPGSDAKGVVVGDGEKLIEHARGGTAVVIGGSNGAAQAALGVARHADHVYLMARSPIISSMSDYQIEALRANTKVTVIENDEIVQAFSDEHGNVTHISTKTGRDIPAQGVGVFVGSAPKTDWLPTNMEKQGGKIVTNENMETNIPGVFAVGDMRVGSIGRVGAAVGDGQMAEKNVFDYFKREKKRLGVFDKIGKKSIIRGERPRLQPEIWHKLVEEAFKSDEKFPFIGSSIEPDIESMDHVRFNPHHDELGRFTTGDGGVSADDPPHVVSLKHHVALKTVAAHAVESAKVPDGGFTLHDDLSAEQEKGYFVSVAGHEAQIPVSQFTPDALLEYRDKNLGVLKNDPSYRIGGWHNAADNLVYLDMSKRFKTKEAAIAFGTQHGQIAGYDAFSGASFHIGARSVVVHTMLGLTLEQELARQAAMHGNPIHAKTLRLAPKQREVAALKRLADTEGDPAIVLTESITVYRGLSGFASEGITGLTGMSFVDVDEAIGVLDPSHIDSSIVFDIVVSPQTRVRRTENEIVLPSKGLYTVGARSARDGQVHYAVTVSWV